MNSRWIRHFLGGGLLVAASAFPLHLFAQQGKIVGEVTKNQPGLPCQG